MALESHVGEGTTRYAVEVRLVDGQTITAGIGESEQVARSHLRSLHEQLNAGGFVVIGESALVRSQEVKYVLLHEEDEAPREGVFDALKSRVRGGGEGGGGGGDRMSTSYGSQPTPASPTSGVRTHAEGGPGFTEQYVGYGRRPWAETKPFFLTSEFLTLVTTILAVGIAMAVSDLLDAGRGWILITILSTGYMVSRGIAKAGTRDPNPQDHSLGGGEGYEGSPSYPGRWRGR
jgi:hypothetical protein